MDKKGAIVIIEENLEDRCLFAKLFFELKVSNEILYFDSLAEAEEALCSLQISPFIFLLMFFSFRKTTKIKI